jgi:hypothetical protein
MPRHLLVNAISLYVIARAAGFHTFFLVERQLRSERLAVAERFRGWEAMLSRWDAYHYEQVARFAYPSSLPLDRSGEVTQNVWAFFPAFPFAAKAVALATGLSFVSAAVVLNLVAGLSAAVLLLMLVRRFASDQAALGSVALWSFFPTAFVLQVPYSEAIYAVAATGCLWALLQHRHGVAACLLLLAGFSRGFTIPLSAAALAAVLQETSTARQTAARRISTATVSLATAAAIAPFIWMVTAAWVTGRGDAFTATQRAWDYSIDLGRWVTFWPGRLERVTTDGPTAMVILTLAAAAGLAVLGWRFVGLPLILRVHVVASALLLFVMTQPGSVAFFSAPRFAFSIVTLPIVLALVLRRRLAILGVVLAFVWLQYLWVLHIWSGWKGIAP